MRAAVGGPDRILNVVHEYLQAERQLGRIGSDAPVHLVGILLFLRSLSCRRWPPSFSARRVRIDAVAGDHPIRQLPRRQSSPPLMTGIPDRPCISVMLIVPDAAAAVSWYEAALGARPLWDLGGVAGLHINGAPFFVHEAVPGAKREPSPTDVGMTTTRIEVFADAPAELIQRAGQAGATALEPLTDHDAPWGTHRQGGFTDPFGHRWSIGDRTPLRPFPR
jgi:PhnB protein